MKTKICVITGSRAEYGVLVPLLKKIKSDKWFNLQIVSTGMHLSPEFGLTYKEIKKDGFKIDGKVEMLLSSDTEVGITKSIGLGMIGFADVFFRLKPNMVVLLGDRFEVFAAATAAFVAKIPIAHISGGDLTEGAMDDTFRHSITKMSLLHFASTQEYRKRIIQLGESPDRVFNVGALGIDNIKKINLLSKEKLQRDLKFRFGEKTILVTFHPVTLENNTTEFQLNELLRALSRIRKVKIIFTKSNADTHGRIINRIIDNFVAKNPTLCKSYISLGQLRYLSVLKHVDLVVGNSSSGIIEAPSFYKPSINIGDRQKGRIKAKSVINCQPETAQIEKAINLALSGKFRQQCRRIKNPHGNGATAEKIIKLIKKNLHRIKGIKKHFYDLKAV